MSDFYLHFTLGLPHLYTMLTLYDCTYVLSQHFFLSSSVIGRITLHGFPTATLSEGISFTTTLPAPITQPSPMVTPPHTVTFPAIQQLFPIVIGFAYSLSVMVPSDFAYWFLSCQRRGCIGVSRDTLGPMNTLSPMVTGQQSTQVKLKFA